MSMCQISDWGRTNWWGAIAIIALVPALAQGQSLIGFWEAEGDATATIGTDGALVNGAGFAAGQFGQGFSFNGASQQSVNVPGGGGLDGASQGTISMWVQWNGIQDGACCGGTFGNVISRQDNGVSSNNIIGLNSADPAAGGLTWQPYSAAGPAISGGTPVGDGTFRHVAVTFSNGHHALYLDGALQGATATTGTMNANGVDLAIGAWNGDGAGYSTSTIDDVAVFNRELSIGQIQSLASGSARPFDVADPLSISGVTASSELGAGFNRVAGNTIDGVGRGTITPDGSPGQGIGMWLSEGIGFGGPGDDADPQITFDLGAPTDIGQMVLFNYNEPGVFLGRGVADVEILTSLNGVDFTSLGVESFAPGTGDGANPGQAVDLDVLAQFVRLDILSNQNGDVFPNPTGSSDFAFVGLNEVEFFAATAVVPEPSALAVWSLLGIVGLVALQRRRKARG